MTDKQFTTLAFGADRSDWPLSETIVLQGGIATFVDQIGRLQDRSVGLTKDIEFLRTLEPGETYYGALINPIYPFICVLPSEQIPPTARDILTAVKARHFRSQHIASLDETYIPYPGYHPGTENDEIHSDFWGQGVFSHEEEVDEFTGIHGILKRYVADQRLWYVLLHTTPRPYEEFMFSEYVILFVIGKSPQADRCVGVVAHQVCHNYCD
jgi:hypothetical protein